MHQLGPNIFCLTILDPKQFGVKKVLDLKKVGPKNVWAKNIFSIQKKEFGPQKFLVKKVLDPLNFVYKKLYEPTIFQLYLLDLNFPNLT